MFGKLTLEQRKALQAILIQSGMIALDMRGLFLSNAGLGSLLATLPMGEVDTIFAGALVRECERLGTPPSLGEYATVLLVVALRDGIEGQSEAIKILNAIIAMYTTDSKYNLSKSSTETSD